MSDISALFSVLSIACIFYLLFYANAGYQLRLYRERLFSLRDELFDEACTGRVGFESSSYGILRSTLNGSIQYAHRLSLAEMLIFGFLMRKEKTPRDVSFSHALDRAKANASNDERELINRYEYLMHAHLCQYLVMSSPLSILSLLIIPAAIFTLFRHCALCVFDSSKGFFNRLERMAERCMRASLPIDHVDSVAFAAGREGSKIGQ